MVNDRETDPKRLRDDLGKSRELCRVLAEGAEDYVVIITRDRLIEYISPAAAALIGLEPEAFIGRHYAEFAPEDVGEMQGKGITLALEGGEEVRVEGRYAFRKATVWLDTRLVPARDAKGRIDRVLVLSHDTTRRREAEQSLRASEDRLELIADSLPVLVAYVDAEQRYRYNNRAYEFWFGISRDEMNGRHVREVLGESTYEAILPHIEAVLAGRRVSFEQEVPCSSGGSRHVAATYIPDVGPAGDVRGFAALVLDDTERKNAQIELRRSEQRYRDLFEEAPVALWEFDSSGIRLFADRLAAAGGQTFREYLEEDPENVMSCWARSRIVGVNRTALDLFEAESREDYQRNVGRVFLPAAIGVVRNFLIRLMEGQRVFDDEFPALTLKGRRLHLATRTLVVPGHEETLDRVLVSVADLTDLRRAEEEVEKHRRAAAMERLEALAVSGRLAAGVAHEINSPLQGIKGQLQLLREELPAGLRDGKRIAFIEQGIGQIAGVVSGLLDLHRHKDDEARDCGFMRSLRNVESMISTLLLESHVSLEVECEPEDLRIPMECPRMAQILVNLVLNARDAMSGGGAVRIRARQTQAGVIVSVADDGAGMTAEDREKVFMPFFTTKGGKGTGLGLTVVRTLVEDAGGTIEVDSEEGKGATFSLRFPAEPTVQPGT